MFREEGNMWVYRKGEISHSSAASKTYSCYTRTACQLERAYIFSALEEKEQSMSCQQKEERQKDIGVRPLVLNCKCKMNKI